ncbi:response regulator [Fuchsiella alkaliacetigena]|uniref:response regulator n=1 Tax=Fuchsiella alkaliacetigena TaxID=957042 RepID=UPI00200B4607|nr:response regulator [Fuchsiella alkaliacetigena]MCK8825732.1 response regulator [Fuchsiella alkaliacetigena]
MSEEELILVVDDNRQNVQILGRILKKSSYKVAVANSGKEALDFIARKLPDLILLDIMMPGMTGFEVCKSVKEKPKTEEIPVIFISALTETEDKLKGFNLGGVDYITKPFQKEEVLARVKTQLELSRTKKELKEKTKEQEQLLAELKYRARLENLVIDLSKEFINFKDNGDIQPRIEQGLGKIAKFIGVDYAFIYLFSADNEKVEEVFRWLRKDFKMEAAVDIDKCFTLKDFSWALNKLEAGELIDIVDTKELSAAAKEEQEFLRSKNIKSSLLLPLEYSQELKGVLGFNSRIKKHQWQEEEISLFRVVANIFINTIQRKKSDQKLKEYYQEIEGLYNNLEEKIDKASELHQQFLPKNLPQIEGIAYDTYFQPSYKLGGDFYDIIQIEDQLIIYLADVSGHGLDGTLLNIFLRETINNYLLYQHESGEILDPLRLIRYITKRYSQENFPGDYFICLLLGVLEVEKQKLTFANAGFQIPPLIITKDGELSPLFCSGLPITSMPEAEALEYQQVEHSLKAGETFFLTTDGLIEETINKEEGRLIPYGEERLKEVLAANYYLPPELINYRVRKDFENFAGSIKGQDDITFLTLRKELQVIDSFESSICSSCAAMHKLKEKLMEFIAPYYEPPSLICIGFEEMVINAIEHGNQLDKSKKVDIRVEVTEQYIKATIEDEGTGFDWTEKATQVLDVERDFDGLEERGRGIKMTNKLYDELWYNEKGNQVNLLKLRE